MPIPATKCGQKRTAANAPLPSGSSNLADNMPVAIPQLRIIILVRKVPAIAFWDSPEKFLFKKTIRREVIE
jgi:hypothetical protein